MTGVIIALVIAMVAVIYWRGAFVHTPTTAIVIDGDVSLDGAIVSVSGMGQSGRAVDLTTPLNRDNGYRTPVLLDPGVYHVIVHRGGTIVLDREVRLEEMVGQTLDLPPAVAFTGASSLGDLHVRITPAAADGPPLELMLDAGHHYRAVAYLPVGNYRLVAQSANSERVTASMPFAVNHLSPIRIDLAAP